MRCPKCEGDTKVYDSRMSGNGAQRWRRRRCFECLHEFDTLEQARRRPSWARLTYRKSAR